MRAGPRGLLLLSLLACTAPPPPSLPRIVSATPTGPVAPDAVTVEILVSAPLDPAGLEDGRFFALCRREDLRDVVAQAESEDGIAAGAPVVPARAALADGRTRAVLTPAAPLQPDQAWAAVLSRRARSADGRPVLDPEGHLRTFALLFETAAAVDRKAPVGRWILPPHGPAPANLASLRVAFDEPVSGALALGRGSPGARAVTVAADVLGLDLSGPLPSGNLALDARGVRDASGNGAAPIAPIAVSACSTSAAPVVAADAQVAPGELSVSVEASLAGMGRLVAELSAYPGEPSCGAAPEAPAVATVLGDVAACPGWDPCSPAAVECPARLEVRGLCPGQPVRMRLATEDLAGHRSQPGAWVAVSSLPPRPAPALTEALADADTPEAGGEYVEVANLGTGDADLTGYSLAKRTASGSFSRCQLTPAAMEGVPIPPGGHALVVGGAYDGRYTLPPETVLYHCGNTALAGGLANDRPVALALEDPTGQQVSTMGIQEAVQRCPQGSLERVHPAGPDAASNFACPGARTPGACNRSTPPEECPKLPW
jgi:hypothetical protein